MTGVKSEHYMRNQPWLGSEDELVLACFKKGWSDDKIAKKLRFRSELSVKSRRLKLGCKLHNGTKERIFPEERPPLVLEKDSFWTRQKNRELLDMYSQHMTVLSISKKFRVDMNEIYKQLILLKKSGSK